MTLMEISQILNFIITIIYYSLLFFSLILSPFLKSSSDKIRFPLHNSIAEPPLELSL